MLLHPKGCCPKLVAKAEEVILLWQQRIIPSKKLKHHGFSKLDVGFKYRLVTSDYENWKLVTHEEYNGYVSKNKGRRRVN